MGERVIKCCCMTGSTDAATDVVESATFRKTFNAIQSLQGHAFRFQISAATSWIRTLRIASESGMHRRSDRYESSTESAVSERNRRRRRCRTRSLMTWLVTYPHRIRILRELIVPLSSGPEPELMSRSQHLSAHAITSRTGSALLARLSITPRNSTSSN
jgi:hypothetical protein